MQIKFTKIQPKQYLATTGEHIHFYTSKQIGQKNSDGWYISSPAGERSLYRFATLRDAKQYICDQNIVAA